MRPRAGYSKAGSVEAVKPARARRVRRPVAPESLRADEVYLPLFERNPLPMWVYHRQSLRFLAVNQAVLKQYGYSREDFTTMTVPDMFPREEQARLADLFARRCAAADRSGPWKHVRRDGSRLDVEILCVDVTYLGRPARLVVAIDVTQRLKAEEEQRHAEEKYRLIFENATEEIIQTTPTGKYLTANPAAARMLGFDSPEQLMAEYDDLNRRFYVKPSRRQEFLQLMQQDGEVVDFELEVYRRDGTTIWISENSTAIRDENGEVLYYQGTAQDITERKHAEELLSRQVRHMAAQRRIDAAISGTFDLRGMLNMVLNDILQVLEVDAAAVSLLAPKSMRLEVVLAKGFHTRHIESSPLLLSAAAGLRMMHEQRAMTVSDLRVGTEATDRQSLMDAEKFVFYSGIPLVSKGRIRGLLEVFQRSTRSRSEDWLQLLDALAAQTAIAIENASMFQDLQRSNLDLSLAYEATIEGWSRALDLRDKETEGHTLRVTERTLMLARSLGVRPEELSHIRRGALLHDIGKIAVPDSILLKPGPLTDEEWVVMRRHPDVAYEMLAPISYLGPALDIPYCHHEKWDGSGYPRGLKGDQIPLAARMFAVVDVWDALSSERPYRPAWAPEKVLDHLQAQSGSHFDPHVVESFLGLLSDA